MARWLGHVSVAGRAHGVPGRWFQGATAVSRNVLPRAQPPTLSTPDPVARCSAMRRLFEAALHVPAVAAERPLNPIAPQASNGCATALVSDERRDQALEETRSDQQEEHAEGDLQAALRHPMR